MMLSTAFVRAASRIVPQFKNIPSMPFNKRHRSVEVCSLWALEKNISTSRLLGSASTALYTHTRAIHTSHVLLAIGKGIAPPSKTSFDKVRQVETPVDHTGRTNELERLRLMAENKWHIPPEVLEKQKEEEEASYLFPNPFIQHFVLMSFAFFAIGGYLYWRYYETPNDEVILRYRDEAIANRKATEDAIARIFSNAGAALIDDRDPKNLKLIGYDPSKSNTKIKEYVSRLAEEQASKSENKDNNSNQTEKPNK